MYKVLCVLDNTKYITLFPVFGQYFVCILPPTLVHTQAFSLVHSGHLLIL